MRIVGAIVLLPRKKVTLQQDPDHSPVKEAYRHPPELLPHAVLFVSQQHHARDADSAAPPCRVPPPTLVFSALPNSSPLPRLLRRGCH
jgi:hypothetical protein